MTKTRKRWLLAGLMLLLLIGLIGGCTPAEPATTSRPTVTKAPATTTGTTASAQTLTANALKEIETFLNKAENNGFISYNHFYSRPEDVSLYEVFYSSSALVEGTERETCLQAGIGVEAYPLFKVTRAEAEATVQKKLGISLTNVVEGMSKFRYMESTDAYYLSHTDSNYWTVTVLGGTITREGLYAVRYRSTNTGAQDTTVTLRKTEDGYQFVSNLSDASAKKTLSAEEQKAIQDYLNAEENNGFIGSLNLYAAPQEASLWAIFYDGAGVGSWDMGAWSEEEKQALLTAAGWEEFYVKVIKIPAADAAKVVQEKLGIPLSAMSAPLDYHYLEAYDAYYHMHSDTNLQTVTVTGGTVSGDLYTVYYTAGFENETFTVVLRKTATGYQFVSNKKGKKD